MVGRQIKKKNVCYRTVSALLISYLRTLSKYKSPGPYIRRGDSTKGFAHYEFGGLLFGGAYT